MLKTSLFESSFPHRKSSCLKQVFRFIPVEAWYAFTLRRPRDFLERRSEMQAEDLLSVEFALSKSLALWVPGILDIVSFDSVTAISGESC